MLDNCYTNKKSIYTTCAELFAWRQQIKHSSNNWSSIRESIEIYAHISLYMCVSMYVCVLCLTFLFSLGKGKIDDDKQTV